MPFTFKPEIAPAEGQASAAPVASFGNASSTNMMERAKEEGKSLFGVLLFVIFGLVVLIAIGVSGYHYYLSTQIESKKATLASYESRLGSLPLEDMRKLSNRIKVINQLVKEHPSANVAFRIIEDSVENEIVYNRFDLRYSDSGKSYALQLGGVSPDYKGLAQQVDTLKRKPYSTYIQNVVVDGISPDDTGRIGFTLRMPISITGILPEELNLSEGAADRMASGTLEVDGVQPIDADPMSGATTTGSMGSSTPNR